MSSGRLSGKVAIITGASRGQGEAQARLFAQEGAKVLLADRLVAEGEAVSKSIGPDARFVELDVTSRDEWKSAVECCTDAFGAPTILVNNAGVFHGGPIEDLAEEDFRRLFEVNMLGTLFGMQAVIPGMRSAGGGSIVNISSAQGLMAMPYMAAYSATKFGLTGLTQVAALELGAQGIRVNTVHPGAMANQMYGREVTAASQRSKFYDRLPIPRPGEVEETAKMVLFVASDDASYATGSTFVSDGGLLAGVLSG